MKKYSISLILFFVIFLNLSVFAQNAEKSELDNLDNIVLVGTYSDPDFKPYETRLLSKGTYLVKAIKPEGVPMNRIAWASWNSLDNWGKTDCDQEKHGWNTDFNVSVIEYNSTTNYKQLPIFTSARCRTQKLAVERAEKKKIVLANISVVTFHLSGTFGGNKKPIGGGIVLKIEKLSDRAQQQEQQQQNRKN